MKTLIIDGTGRDSSNSKTKYLADKIIANMNLEEVETIDLYKSEIPYLTIPMQELQKADDTSIYATRLLHQFEAADQYIFIYPTWNWSVPAIVRAYLDLVVISGRTFGYDAKGRKIGLLKQKRAILISTTGGKTYSRPIASIIGAQSGDNYTKQILRTMGVKDIKQYSIDNTAYDFKTKEGNFDQQKYDQRCQQIAAKVKQ